MQPESDDIIKERKPEDVLPIEDVGVYCVPLDVETKQDNAYTTQKISKRGRGM